MKNQPAGQQGALYSALTVRQNVQLPMIEHVDMHEDARCELAMLKIRLAGLPADAGLRHTYGYGCIARY